MKLGFVVAKDWGFLVILIRVKIVIIFLKIWGCNELEWLYK